MLLQTASIWSRPLPHERVKRIYDGRELLMNEFPFMARLYRTDFNSTHCTGSLVRERWVMTALHCLKDFNLANLRVSIWGVDGLSLPVRSVSRFFYFDLPAVTITLPSLLESQEFEPNDVAWLLLGEPVRNAPLSPISYTEVDDAAQARGGQQLTYMGWGGTGGFLDPLPDHPSRVETSFATQHLFPWDQRYFIFTYYIDPVTGISGGIGGADSGGPAVTVDSEGVVKQVGVQYFWLHDAGDNAAYDASIRLTDWEDRIVSVVGWSDDAPWRWEDYTSDTERPLGTWRPSIIPESRLFVCRDGNNQVGEMFRLFHSWQCRLAVSGNVIDTFQVLSGSLLASYEWTSAARLLNSDEAFAIADSGSGMATALTPVDSTLCRTLQAGEFRIGQLEGEQCRVAGDLYEDADVLMPLGSAEYVVTTTEEPTTQTTEAPATTDKAITEAASEPATAATTTESGAAHYYASYLVVAVSVLMALVNAAL